MLNERWELREEPREGSAGGGIGGVGGTDTRSSTQIGTRGGTKITTRGKTGVSHRRISNIRVQMADFTCWIIDHIGYLASMMKLSVPE